MSWKAGFAELCAKTHTEQAKWWLNGFWEAGAREEADKVWEITHKFVEQDIGRPILYGGRMAEYKENCDLDEFKSHVVLEKLGETLTVQALRKRLQALDIDNNKRMALSEYLLDKYGKTPEQLVTAPQGSIDPKIIAEAEAKFEAATKALDVSVQDAEAAAAALEEARRSAAEAAAALAEAERTAAAAAAAKQEADSSAAAAADAKNKADNAAQAAKEAKEDADDKAEKSNQAYLKVKAAEDLVRQAEDELKHAVDEITALEKSKADKLAELQVIIDDPNTGTVKKGKAVQEAATIQAEDPLPLRKAKITQEAALKKVEKERKAAEEVTAGFRAIKQTSDDAAAAAAAKKQEADDAAAAAAARKQEADDSAAAAAARKQEADDAAAAAAQRKQAAEDAQAASEAAKQKADDAAEAARQAVKEAEQNLEDLKSNAAPLGAIWWMERVLTEKKKFMKK